MVELFFYFCVYFEIFVYLKKKVTANVSYNIIIYT